MNSLRTLYLVIIMLISLSMFILVNSFTNNNANTLEVVYVNDLNYKDNNLVVNVYLLNYNNDIAYQTFYFDDLDNLYYDVFSIYNEKMNSIDQTLFSPLIFYENVEEFTVSDNRLYISLNKVSELTDIDLMMDCLYLTYNEIGVSELTLKIGKSVFTKCA